MQKLSVVIGVDEEKCVDCRMCISACPVKYCNDCSSGYLIINHDICIGCGQCIDVCTHDARYPIDDFGKFNQGLENKEKIVAIVAPAVASNFENNYMKLNGWLKSIGVDAIFDVSFGAELTVKSYIDYIEKNGPKTVIAQPCPAIVSFIQIYRPELIPYLAPADSPMAHTIKMIKEFYHDYKDHKVVVISPCVAKKREFEEIGAGDYNVSFISIDKYFKENNINLENFDEVEFEGPLAERAVLFSTPGGLLRTVQRYSEKFPDISTQTRKIEGVELIYEYLRGLNESIEKGYSPLLVDCLSCELGCNGGTGTLNRKHLHEKMDKIEHLVEERKKELIKKYNEDLKEQEEQENDKIQPLEEVINKYWKPGLYNRTYQDLSDNLKIKMPTQKEIEEIFVKMNKFCKRDIYNCACCGYGSCEGMAIAIYNGLNVIENCLFYKESQIVKYSKNLEKMVEERTEKLNKANKELSKTLDEVRTLKVQQDGDYFLTSLLIDPLILNSVSSENIKVDFYMVQKKKFAFKKWNSELGGDICVAHTIELRNRKYTAFVNGDAMGKSIQGAGGSIILGVMFNAFITRTKFVPGTSEMSPEDWLIRCYRELQDVFSSFDGSMLISVVLGIIDDDTGTMYYFNAEHPWNILYRNGKATFIEKELVNRKIGTTVGDIKVKIETFKLEPNDIVFAGSDGRDDILLGYEDETGARIINEDETLFLKCVEKGNGNLEKIAEEIAKIGDLTDDLSLIRLAYKEKTHEDEKEIIPQEFYDIKKEAIKKYNNEEYYDAIELFRKAIKLNKDVVCYNGLIVSLMKEKRFKAALTLSEKALDFYPDNLKLIFKASLLNKRFKHFEKAIYYGKRYYIREPNHLNNLINLTDISISNKNYEQAMFYIQQAESIDSKNKNVRILKRILNAIVNR